MLPESLLPLVDGAGQIGGRFQFRALGFGTLHVEHRYELPAADRVAFLKVHLQDPTGNFRGSHRALRGTHRSLHLRVVDEARRVDGFVGYQGGIRREVGVEFRQARFQLLHFLGEFAQFGPTGTQRLLNFGLGGRHGFFLGAAAGGQQQREERESKYPVHRMEC